MAMRPRGRTGNQPFRQPFRQAYETLNPRSEWKHENDATLLLVHLPGFVREQIRVMFTYIDDASVGIKIQGQRPLPNGRWSQFTEVFIIPETCDASKINSQFERGLLTVVMPQLIVTKPNDQQIAEPKATQERRTPSPQTSAPEKTPSPKTTREIKAPSPKTTREIKAPSPKTSTDPEKTPTPKTTKEIKTPSPQTSSPESSSGSESPERQSPQRGESSSGSESPERENSSGSESSERQSPQRGEKKLAETATTQKPTRDEKTHKGEDKSTSPEAAVKQKPGEEKPLVEEKSQKGGDESISSKGAALVEEKKEKQGADDQTEKLTPEKNNVLEEIKGVVQGKEPVAVSEKKKKKGEDGDDDKRSGKKGENGVEEMNKREEEVKYGNGGVGEIEERTLLVNMGMALLVLMGLGAFISYKIASSGKP